ncbi:MAG: hypothetical protein IPN60_02510 [Saprospiraceae bacterium]|nr:hypothetical protein [Candidatus Opimibacter skivensis]
MASYDEDKSGMGNDGEIFDEAVVGVLTNNHPDTYAGGGDTRPAAFLPMAKPLLVSSPTTTSGGEDKQPAAFSHGEAVVGVLTNNHDAGGEDTRPAAFLPMAKPLLVSSPTTTMLVVGTPCQRHRESAGLQE